MGTCFDETRVVTVAPFRAMPSKEVVSTIVDYLLEQVVSPWRAGPWLSPGPEPSWARMCFTLPFFFCRCGRMANWPRTQDLHRPALGGSWLGSEGQVPRGTIDLGEL